MSTSTLERVGFLEADLAAARAQRDQLLAACEGLLAVVSSSAEPREEWLKQSADAWDKCRAAVAHAKGVTAHA